MKRITLALCSISLSLSGVAHAAGFDIVTLGARGGIEDGNLSAFLISPAGDPRGVTCDAGALVNGLKAADGKGAFDNVTVPADSDYTRIGYMLTENVKGYLISHAHMDHIAGLIAASPDDSKKPIYGLPSVNADIETTYFNWDAWPNFGDRGKAPQLKKYALTDLKAGEKTGLANTAMGVTAYPLAHSGVESTAFLVESGDEAVLCFGDTGPDDVEKSTAIGDIWTAIAGKVRDKKLKAVIVEVSYVNTQPDKFLFGHLTPAWLLKSLRGLEEKVGKGSLKDLPVIISHIKYSLKKGESPQDAILKELQADNDVGASFIIPEQGMKWTF